MSLYLICFWHSSSTINASKRDAVLNLIIVLFDAFETKKVIATLELEEQLTLIALISIFTFVILAYRSIYNQLPFFIFSTAKASTITLLLHNCLDYLSLFHFGVRLSKLRSLLSLRALDALVRLQLVCTHDIWKDLLLLILLLCGEWRLLHIVHRRGYLILDYFILVLFSIVLAIFKLKLLVLWNNS